VRTFAAKLGDVSLRPSWTRRAGGDTGKVIDSPDSPAPAAVVPPPEALVTAANGYGFRDAVGPRDDARPQGDPPLKPVKRVKSVLAWASGVVAVTVMTGVAIITLSTTQAPPQARPLRPAPDALARPGGAPVLVWTPGGLAPALGPAARGVADVQLVAEVAGDFAWLDAWARSGAEPSVPPPGMSIPVDIAAVDIAEFLPFATGPDRAVLAGMTQDSIVLSKTGASLRGLDRGGWLRFGATTLTVSGIVDDAVVGGHEAIVAKQAGALIGVTQPRYLLVQLKPHAGAEALDGALRGALPAGGPLRVGVPASGTVLRAGEPRLTPAGLKLLFGEFAAARGRRGALQLDPRWVDANIEERSLPIVGLAKCHKALFPQVEGALNEVVAAGLSASIQPGEFGGCWFPRFVNWDPEAGISHHTWGLAVDFNVAHNLYGTPGTMDPRVVEIFERWGFEWGGRWLVPDPMHFEFVSFVPPRT
jgi:D-alanyl-D-alanine carboxypeptidase-like protein